MRIYTLGHSNRSTREFLDMLVSARSRCVADVRARPGSRRHPQFGRDALSESLAGEGLSYVHLPDLGGRRPPRPDSVNDGWSIEGFRGYADHLGTSDFERGLQRLMALAEDMPCAIMCAERDPMQCHRRIIADVLVLRGVEVIHLIHPDRS